jgi:hypothetical protein
MQVTHVWLIDTDDTAQSAARVYVQSNVWSLDQRMAEHCARMKVPIVISVPILWRGNRKEDEHKSISCFLFRLQIWEHENETLS